MHYQEWRGLTMITKELLIEALLIAKDNFDFDAEYHKAEEIERHIEELSNE
jgi:hypothetical protein